MKKNFFDRDALHRALDEYVSDYVTTLPEEKESEKITFSPAFEEKMARLLRKQKTPHYYLTNTAFKKAVCVLAALLILAALATVGVGAFRSPHEYLPATCTLPMQCTHCDRTAGEPLGHVWIPATCTKAMYCSVCGETQGEPRPHSFADATCTTPKTCTDCGATEGEPLPHSFETVGRVEPTCTKEGTLSEKCTVCGEQRITTLAKSEHRKLSAANCLRTAICLDCGKVFDNERGPHNYSGMNGACIWCGKGGQNRRPDTDGFLFDGPASIFGEKGSPGIKDPFPSIPWDYHATQNHPFWNKPWP